MATERCPGCDRGLRDGVCVTRDCEWNPGPATPRMVKPAVDKPSNPPPTPPPAPPTPPPPPTPVRSGARPWKLPAEVCELGLAMVAENLQKLAEEAPVEPSVRDRLRHTAAESGSAKARSTAAEVLDELVEVDG